MKVVKEIHNKIRPMITIFRIWVQNFLRTVAFQMVITNFFVQSKYWLVPLFELVLMILWAKHFSIVGGQLTRIISTSILTLIVISQYLFLELDYHGNNYITEKPSTSRQRVAIDVVEYIGHQVNAISKIRKYNQISYHWMCYDVNILAPYQRTVFGPVTLWSFDFENCLQR